MENWNGSTWSVVPTPKIGEPIFDSEFNGIVALSTNDVWTVGDYIRVWHTYIT